MVNRDGRYSMREVAREAGVSLETVWRWTLRGVKGRRLHSFLVGGRRYVARIELEKFLGDDGGQTTDARANRNERATCAGAILESMGVVGKHGREKVSTLAATSRGRES